MVEFIGYVASALVVLSLTMSSVFKLRVLSLLGSTTFLIYGLLIDAFPVVVTNGVIMAIQVVFLTRIVRRQEAFDVVEVDGTSRFLNRFFEFHHDDIQEAWPGWEHDPEADRLRLVVFRDMSAAGVFIARIDEDVARVDLDYAAPDYRDLKNARLLYGDRSRQLSERGISTVVTTADSPQHRQFLQRFGFARDGDDWVFHLP